MSLNPANLESQPSSNKRRRTNDMTPEERKEARAHRNRIAAQNSRDRRKAHYTSLDQRVADLEAENQQLKAQSPSSEIAKENAELRERIKTLENGWQTVLTALAAQGLSIPNVGPALTQSSTATPAATTVSPTALSPQPSSAPAPPTTLSLSPPSTHKSSDESLSCDFGSPSFSRSPLDLDMSEFDLQSSPEGSSMGLQTASDSDSTCHLAAGDLSFTASSPSIENNLLFPLPDNDQVIPPSSDKIMDSFLQQILSLPTEETSLSSHSTSKLLEMQTISPSSQVASVTDVADLDMQWSQPASLTDVNQEAFKFDTPISLNIDWSTFDSSAQPEATDETLERMLDTYTWSSVQV